MERMMIEITAPCCLTLAALRYNNQPALLGLTLRYPTLQLLARPSEQLMVTGARADAVFAAAERFLEAHRLRTGADTEIELAIPSYMGLASTPIIGLAVARALAALNGLPTDTNALAAAIGLSADEGLAAQSFTHGGLLIVDEQGQLVQRSVLPHDDEQTDWVVILVLPRVPRGTADDLEAVALRSLWSRAAQLGDEAEQLVRNELWPALEGRQSVAFGAALMRLQALASPPPALSPAEEATLALMREYGAQAYGKAPTGLGLYAIIEGAANSGKLLQVLRQRVGHEGGSVMASICDVRGVSS
jgi:predicted sugar kinase